LLRQQLVGALDGEVDVLAKLERNSTENPKPVGEAPTAVPVHQSTAPPRILWLEGAPDRSLVEVRASDRTGLLALLTGALERAGADIDWAKVTTLGSMVDDVFCVSMPDGADARTVVEQHLLAVLAPGDVAAV
jgi:[protein-PII] uridylyltransferase